MRKLKYKGLHTHRFKDNPEEKLFAEEWDKVNVLGHNLAYLLDPMNGVGGRSPEPTDRENEVAATVIQWLGSPIGQHFLRDLGYVKKSTKMSNVEAQRLQAAKMHVDETTRIKKLAEKLGIKLLWVHDEMIIPGDISSKDLEAFMKGLFKLTH
jgi:ribosome biogenesis SPOUT family RNA methylase Rps3